jgi:hypothetical protein
LQGFKNAFRFINISLQLAFKPGKPRLPWLPIVVGSLLLLLIGLIPMGLVVGLIGPSVIGLLLIGFIAALIITAFFIWGEICMLQTCTRFYHQIQPEAPNNQAASPIKAHWRDGFLLGLMLPGRRIIQWLRQLSSKVPPSQSAWLSADDLLTPIISLENRTLKTAITRLKTFLKNNLIRFSPNLMRVDLIAALVMAFLTIAGGILGFIVGVNVAAPLTASPWRRVLGMALSLLTVWLVLHIGLIFNTYLRATYHTALYTWVRKIETALESDEAEKAQPPKVLLKALQKNYRNQKQEKENAAKT